MHCCSPTKANNKKLVWVSSNTKVATVKQKGTITAKVADKAVITATSQEGGKAAKCTVTVKQAVRKAKPNKTKATLAKGKILQLKVAITPKAATVSASGKAKEVAKEPTTITAVVGNKKVSCKITVK